jgi:transcriptional regulator with XRE-family HTH domain
MRISNRTSPRLRGSRLAEAMLLRGWNKQTALAEALGVKPSAVSRWLKNGSLSLENAVALCDFLDISLDWLMLGRGKPDPDTWPQPERHEERSQSALQTKAREALKIFTTALPELFARGDSAEGIKETHLQQGSPTESAQPAKSGSATTDLIEVALRNGHVLRLPDSFAPARIVRLVEALEGLAQ